MSAARRRELDDLVDAVERELREGDEARAVELLTAAEGRLFLDGYGYAAGEIGFARFQLGRGDRIDAVEVLRRLVARERP